MPYWNEPDAMTQFAELLRDVEDRVRANGGIPTNAREAGEFLNVLAKVAGARTILEVGVGDGYTTLWLAEAASNNNGNLISVEGDVWRLEMVRETLMRSPHAGCIRLIQGEPEDILPVLEGPFDFVLLDGDQTQALRNFHMVFDRISSGSIICCGNAIAHATVLAEYLTYVHDSPGLESVLVPIGDGIEITYKLS